MAKLTVVKKVDNAVLYEDEKGQPYIRIDNVRASFPYFGTPSEDENDNGDKVLKWRVSAMLPKDTHVAAKDLVKSVIQKLIKENSQVPADRWFLSNGDEKEQEEMHGHWLISASDGKIRPRVRDENNEPMLDVGEIDQKFYGGCWINILIRPWFFDGKSKNSKKTLPKRVCAGIQSAVFVKDDKPFGNGRIDDGEVWGDPEYDAMGGDDDRSSRRSRSRRDDDDDGADGL